MAVDLMTNLGSAKITAGGTDAPDAGTVETWTAASQVNIPVASSTANPPTQFRAVDPANPTEIMLVTNVAAAAWTVTRGAEGSTPVAHVANFTVIAVFTTAGLLSWLQANATAFDAAGAAAAAQSGAQSFATAAVATETTRAEAAEANRWNQRGTWTGPGTNYLVNDVVDGPSGFAGGVYICITAHTSGSTFSGPGANWAVVRDPLGTYAPKVEKWVAAVDTPAALAAQADYVCDGVNDDVELNAALTAAGADGIVRRMVGNFVIGAPIALNQHGQVFEGPNEWRGTAFSSSASPVSSLKLANSANCNMFEVTGRKCRISKVYLDGNMANNTSVAVNQTFTDGVITGGTNLASATGAFTTADIGRTVTGTGIPGGTTITAVSGVASTGASSCTLSQACTNGSAISFTVNSRTVTCNLISAINGDTALDLHLDHIYGFNFAGNGLDLAASEVTGDRVYLENGNGIPIHTWGTAKGIKISALLNPLTQAAVLDESSGLVSSSSSQPNVGYNTYDLDVIANGTAEGVIFAYGTGKSLSSKTVIKRTGKEAIKIVGGARGVVIPSGVRCYNTGVLTTNTYDAIGFAQGVDGLWPAPVTISGVTFIQDHPNLPRYLFNEGTGGGPHVVTGCTMPAGSYGTAPYNKTNAGTILRHNIGATNSPEYLDITLDTSRFIGAGRFESVLGSPARATVGTDGLVWTFAHGASQAVASWLGAEVLPKDWATFNVDAYIINDGAGAGNYVIFADYVSGASGADISATPTAMAGSQVVTAGTQNIIQVTRLGAGIAVPAVGSPIAMRVCRNGGSGSDTLANIIGFVGLLLTKAS